MKVLSEKIKSKDQDIYHVHFEKGSKTKLHLHNGLITVLIAINGKVCLDFVYLFQTHLVPINQNSQLQATQRINLNQDDIVHIPAKTLDRSWFH